MDIDTSVEDVNYLEYFGVGIAAISLVGYLFDELIECVAKVLEPERSKPEGSKPEGSKPEGSKPESSKPECLKFVIDKQSKKFYVIHMIFLAAISFLALWICFIDKKALYHDSIGESVTTVTAYGAGIASVVNPPTQAQKLWDATDLSVPAQKSDTLFIATKLVKTVQHQPSCCPRRLYYQRSTL